MNVPSGCSFCHRCSASEPGFVIRAILSIMGMEMDIEVLSQAVFTVTAYGGSGHQNFAEPILGCFTELVIIPFWTFHL